MITGHPLAELVRHKDELLTQEFSALQKMSRVRGNALMAQLQLHEFLRECAELRKWIKEKMVAAASPGNPNPFKQQQQTNSGVACKKTYFSLSKC